MEDILAVYQQPYDPKRLQVCLDEIHKNLRSTPKGEILMEKGKPKRQDYEYERVRYKNLGRINFLEKYRFSIF